MQRSSLDNTRLQELETAPDTRDLLHDLVQRVEVLRPDHRDPQRFHEEKSEIAPELVKLARKVA